MVPILDRQTLDIISRSADQTRRLGARLGRLLISGDLICLEGELGTGKTCLAQGIGQGLGVREPVVSPTFTLIREYKAAEERPPFHHIDFYRLEDVEEALALGLEEYLYGDGVCVIEWAEKVKAVLPSERLWITLRHLDETKRGLLIEASGQRYEELLREFRRVAFGV
jgi:tRNA threonylcarbamoyladenosine biosynthesis protein TsaE